MFKSRKHAIAAGFVIFLLAVLILFLLAQKFDSSSMQLTLEEDPIACYSEATSRLSDNRNMELVVSEHEIIQTKENVFHTRLKQDISYVNRDSNDFKLQVTETIETDQHDTQTSVVYASDLLYYTINGSKFTGAIDPMALSAQYPPSIILDANNYRTIKGLRVGNSTVIRFSDPSYPEEWVGIETGSFLDACGTAWINRNGGLVKATYNLCYTKGNVTVYRSVTVQTAGTDPDPITVPNDTGDYLEISDPLLPRQLEIACGYLLQSQNIEASYTDTTTCQIFGDTRVQNIDILIENGNQNPYLQMATTIDITNSSREGEVLTSNQVQQYDSGNYIISTDNSPAVITKGASSQDLLRSCQEILIGTILLPNHVQDAEVFLTDESYRIEFTASKEFAQKVISDACTTLYNEPQLLDDLSAGHSIDRILCYLEFNNESGLPTKSGIHFLGTYYVSELPYQLIFESDQTYLIP